MGSSDNDKYVEIDTFVDGCMRLKGTATSMGMHTVLVETRSMRHMQAEQNFREKHFQTEAMQRLDALISHLNLHQLIMQDPNGTQRRCMPTHAGQADYTMV